MSTNIYTEDDWDSEMAALYSERGCPPGCPQCGRSGFYGPREAEGSRRYRACKFCGFWQHVGQPAVTNKPTVHNCEEWPKVAGAAYTWWVQPDEEIYTCPYCGVEVHVGFILKIYTLLLSLYLHHGREKNVNFQKHPIVYLFLCWSFCL